MRTCGSSPTVRARLRQEGFARFQNDDFGGGLSSLQALYAPQFAGTFQPESQALTFDPRVTRRRRRSPG
ncbi:MAG: hypothetical protein MUC96_19150 [Myxococcaceae bacterium]|jgi:hypothetical protein|nr:hypothetical protein [Myxococcaceae bacterium]